MGVHRNNIPPELYSRYAIHPRQRFFGPLIAIVSVLVVGTLLFIIGKDLNAGGDVRLLTWNSLSSTEVQIRWSIQRNDNAPVVCVLRAQDDERFDVGYAVVRIRNTAQNPTFVSTLNLRGPLTAVVEPECQAGAGATLTGSHFRPGLLPPAQDLPLQAPWQGPAKFLN